MSDILVKEHQVSYNALGITFKKRAPYTYDLCLFIARHEELKKGYVVKRTNKPTYNGTKVTYKVIDGNCSKEIAEFEKDFEYIKSIYELSELELKDGIDKILKNTTKRKCFI